MKMGKEFHGNFGPLEVSNQKAAKPISHAYIKPVRTIR